ncbi:outer membrane biogenesis protein BamB [Crateriforma conspicua]|uniref:Outer membrane biogenesis protein BamB n=1 Tax=Crateriforma conspicua TaxID=2527996 RepID=A0A5C6FLS0_9PLAN|nr:PQQ-binding-like beta-propeller repeat protein [Crateriforma conspicua]TWU62409.1 outer membrane biogenesis protein BamB [Crateriforma conspicua]
MNRIIHAALVLGAVLFASMRDAGSASAADSAVTTTGDQTGSGASVWNQWRGPDRDGRIPGSSWPDKLDGRLQLQWSKDHSPSYSGPVLLDDLVFTTETIDRKYEQVTAYRLSDGQMVWNRRWEGHMAVPFFAAKNGDWIRSTPACVPGHLVILGMRDVLVSLDPQTGQENWRNDLPASEGTPLQPFGAVCSPLIDGDVVYVQSGGGLIEVDLATGRVLWTVLGGSSDMMSSGAFSSPVMAVIAGKKQLVVQTRLELCGVDPDDGTVLWKTPVEAFRGMNILTPLVIGDRIFTAAHSGRSHLFQIANDDPDGWTVNEVWSQKTQGYMSSPVVIDGNVYLHLKNQRFTCLDLQDGSIRWTSRPIGDYCSLVHNDRQILSLANDGVLRLIEPTSDEFRVVDTAQVATDAWAHLAVRDDLVVVRDLKSLRLYRWTDSANR